MFCYNCGCHLSEHDFCTTVSTMTVWRKQEYGISQVRSTAYGRA